MMEGKGGEGKGGKYQVYLTPLLTLRLVFQVLPPQPKIDGSFFGFSLDLIEPTCLDGKGEGGKHRVRIVQSRVRLCWVRLCYLVLSR